MLKKLVKYGNSNALVLDKPLLELLNIAEGSVVKIKTDGVSLIITPQHAVEQEVSSPTDPLATQYEALRTVHIERSKDPVLLKNYMDEVMAVEERYREAMKKLQTPEFQQEYQELAKQFAGTFGDPAFSRLNSELMNKYMPEYGQMSQELQAIDARYPSIATTTIPQDKQQEVIEVYERAGKIHKKYAHVLQQIKQLQENPQYIHDLVVAAEQYQINKKSQEYLNALNAITIKYIPEYAQYQEELRAITGSVNEILMR